MNQLKIETTVQYSSYIIKQLLFLVNSKLIIIIVKLNHRLVIG